jgi:peroxiredoxin
MKRVVSGAAAAAVLVAWFGLHDASAPPSTFVLLDGTRATTTDLQGKVTLVNFWATTCNACITEMDRVAAAYDKYHAKGFEAVAVAMRSDPPTAVATYAETRRLPFKVAFDDTGALARAWGGVELTPTTYLLDRHGVIVKRYVGEPDFDELQRLIEKLLGA